MSISRRPRGVWVPPLSRRDIRSIANGVREITGFKTARLDVVDFLERELHEREIYFDVMDKEDMGSDHGRCLPDQNLIMLRLDVYEGLHRDVGRDRFTACHEIGHQVLRHSIALPRTAAQPAIHDWISDSEWQADNFAAELLMPAADVTRLCSCPEDIADVFGVSMQAATNRWNNLVKEGLIG